MTYRQLFRCPWPVMGMVHLMGDSAQSVQERARRKIDICLSCGVDAVLVENDFGSSCDVGRTLIYLRENT